MELEEYKLIYELEQGHWWYRGLHELLYSLIRKRFSKDQKPMILDGGCGTGLFLKYLNGCGLAFGIDIAAVALGYCQRRGLSRLAKASVLELPFRNQSFDLVLSADVLYHKQVSDDMRAFSEICRVLKKDGVLIIHLPAHDFFRRRHDYRVHTRHRYNLPELSSKMKENNFDIIKLSYRNSFLFPALFLLSLIGKKKDKKPVSDLRQTARPLNLILYNLLKMENQLIKKVNLPFGTSIICVARKKG